MPSSGLNKDLAKFQVSVAKDYQKERKEADKREEDKNKDIHKKRYDRYQRVRKRTGGMGYTALDLSGSFMRELDPLINKLSGLTPALHGLQGALSGTSGSIFQSAAKSSATAKHLAKEQALRDPRLGKAGQVARLGSGLRLGTSSLVAMNTLAAMAGLGTGGKAGSIWRQMGSSPLTVGLGAATAIGGMMAQNKLKKLQVRRKPYSQMQRKHAIAPYMEQQLYQLTTASANADLKPFEQLNINLLQMIAHASLRTESFSPFLGLMWEMMDMEKQGKDKSSGSFKKKYSNLMYGAEDKSKSRTDRALDFINDNLSNFLIKFDAFSQISNFLLTGKTPKQMLDEQGLGQSGANKLEEKRQKADERDRLGITIAQQGLLTVSPQRIVDAGDTYESKILGLNIMQAGLLQLIADASINIMSEGHGIKSTLAYSHSKGKKQKESSSIMNALNMIPGVSAIANIGKTIATGGQVVRDKVAGATDWVRERMFSEEYRDTLDEDKLKKKLGTHRSSQERGKDFMSFGMPKYTSDMLSLTKMQLIELKNISSLQQQMFEYETGQKFQRAEHDKEDDLVWDEVERRYVRANVAERLIETRQKQMQAERRYTMDESAGMFSPQGILGMITGGDEKKVRKAFNMMSRLSGKPKDVYDESDEKFSARSDRFKMQQDTGYEGLTPKWSEEQEEHRRKVNLDPLTIGKRGASSAAGGVASTLLGFAGAAAGGPAGLTAQGLLALGGILAGSSSHIKKRMGAEQKMEDLQYQTGGITQAGDISELVGRTGLTGMPTIEGEAVQSRTSILSSINDNIIDIRDMLKDRDDKGPLPSIDSNISKIYELLSVKYPDEYFKDLKHGLFDIRNVIALNEYGITSRLDIINTSIYKGFEALIKILSPKKPSKPGKVSYLDDYRERTAGDYREKKVAAMGGSNIKHALIGEDPRFGKGGTPDPGPRAEEVFWTPKGIEVIGQKETRERWKNKQLGGSPLAEGTADAFKQQEAEKKPGMLKSLIKPGIGLGLGGLGLMVGGLPLAAMLGMGGMSLASSFGKDKERKVEKDKLQKEFELEQQRLKEADPEYKPKKWDDIKTSSMLDKIGGWKGATVAGGVGGLLASQLLPSLLGGAKTIGESWDVGSAARGMGPGLFERMQGMPIIGDAMSSIGSSLGGVGDMITSIPFIGDILGFAGSTAGSLLGGIPGMIGAGATSAMSSMPILSGLAGAAGSIFASPLMAPLLGVAAVGTLYKLFGKKKKKDFEVSPQSFAKLDREKKIARLASQYVELEKANSKLEDKSFMSLAKGPSGKRILKTIGSGLAGFLTTGPIGGILGATGGYLSSSDKKFYDKRLKMNMEMLVSGFRGKGKDPKPFTDDELIAEYKRTLKEKQDLGKKLQELKEKQDKEKEEKEAEQQKIQEKLKFERDENKHNIQFDDEWKKLVEQKQEKRNAEKGLHALQGSAEALRKEKQDKIDAEQWNQSETLHNTQFDDEWKTLARQKQTKQEAMSKYGYEHNKELQQILEARDIAEEGGYVKPGRSVLSIGPEVIKSSPKGGTEITGVDSTIKALKDGTIKGVSKQESTVDILSSILSYIQDIHSKVVIKNKITSIFSSEGLGGKFWSFLNKDISLFKFSKGDKDKEGFFNKLKKSLNKEVTLFPSGVGKGLFNVFKKMSPALFPMKAVGSLLSIFKKKKISALPDTEDTKKAQLSLIRTMGKHIVSGFNKLFTGFGNILTSMQTGISTFWGDMKLGISTMYGDFKGLLDKLNPVNWFKSIKSSISKWWSGDDDQKGFKQRAVDAMTFKGTRDKISNMFKSKDQKKLEGQDKLDSGVKKRELEKEEFKTEVVYYLEKIYHRLGKLTEVAKKRKIFKRSIPVSEAEDVAEEGGYVKPGRSVLSIGPEVIRSNLYGGTDITSVDDTIKTLADGTKKGGILGFLKSADSKVDKRDLTFEDFMSDSVYYLEKIYHRLGQLTGIRGTILRMLPGIMRYLPDIQANLSGLLDDIPDLTGLLENLKMPDMPNIAGMATPMAASGAAGVGLYSMLKVKSKDEVKDEKEGKPSVPSIGSLPMSNDVDPSTMAYRANVVYYLKGIFENMSQDGTTRKSAQPAAPSKGGSILSSPLTRILATGALAGAGGVFSAPVMALMGGAAAAYGVNKMVKKRKQDAPPEPADISSDNETNIGETTVQSELSDIAEKKKEKKQNTFMSKIVGGITNIYESVDELEDLAKKDKKERDKGKGIWGKLLGLLSPLMGAVPLIAGIAAFLTGGQIGGKYIASAAGKVMANIGAAAARAGKGIFKTLKTAGGGIIKAGKALLPDILKGVGKGGGAISKLASGLAKVLGITGKAGSFMGRAAGKILPGMGLILGVGFGVKRIKDGDYLGALGEFTSGLLSLGGPLTAPLSLAMDGILFWRDMKTTPEQRRGGLDIAGLVGKGFAKMLGIGARLGKFTGKLGGKLGSKLIPGMGLALGMGLAVKRFKDGDVLGGIGELIGGGLSLGGPLTLPFSFAMDALLYWRDKNPDIKKSTSNIGNIIKAFKDKAVKFVKGTVSSLLGDTVAGWLFGEESDEELKRQAEAKRNKLTAGADGMYKYNTKFVTHENMREVQKQRKQGLSDEQIEKNRKQMILNNLQGQMSEKAFKLLGGNPDRLGQLVDKNLIQKSEDGSGWVLSDIYRQRQAYQRNVAIDRLNEKILKNIKDQKIKDRLLDLRGNMSDQAFALLHGDPDKFPELLDKGLIKDTAFFTDYYELTDQGRESFERNVAKLKEFQVEIVKQQKQVNRNLSGGSSSNPPTQMGSGSTSAGINPPIQMGGSTSRDNSSRQSVPSVGTSNEKGPSSVAEGQPKQRKEDVEGDFAWPSDHKVVTSPFGMRKIKKNGVYVNDMHHGLDIRARMGQPIYAAMDGEVYFAGGKYGTIKVRQPGGIISRYLHLSKFHAEPGQKVEAGDLIGESGKTGGAYIPHLHFDIAKNREGNYIDPELFMHAVGVPKDYTYNNIHRSRQISAKLANKDPKVEDDGKESGVGNALFGGSFNMPTLVGEGGPEMILPRQKGGFDVVNNDITNQLMSMMSDIAGTPDTARQFVGNIKKDADNFARQKANEIDQWHKRAQKTLDFKNLPISSANSNEQSYNVKDRIQEQFAWANGLRDTISDIGNATKGLMERQSQIAPALADQIMSRNQNQRTTEQKTPQQEYDSNFTKIDPYLDTLLDKLFTNTSLAFEETLSDFAFSNSTTHKLF